MLDLETLAAYCETYGIDLPRYTAEKLDAYADLLAEWNDKINLTAIVDPQGVAVKHMLDSLLLASQPEIRGSLVDVGSGAGFPGLVVKAYRPEVEVTLMEPTGKRLRFLELVSDTLDLPVTLLKERGEEAARKQWRESFDAATARAVAALPQLCEYCLPLVKPGGFFIAMKGEVGEEVEASANALQKLGGCLREVRGLRLPDSSKRSLVVIEKVESTPKVYPRNGGTIAKRPL